MDVVIQAAGGTLLTAFVVAIVSLGWKSRAAYGRLVEWVGTALLPVTAFAAGVVYGSTTLPQPWYVSLGFVVAPSVLWLALWSWGIVAADLQGKKPFDTYDDDGGSEAKRKHADESPE